MTTERVGMLITLITILTQAGLYLLSGGFSVGTKLSDMQAEMKMIRQELKSANQIQDYRINKLEEAEQKTK